MSNTSKAMLTYAVGMNLDCIDSMEAENGGQWHRIEVRLSTEDTLSSVGYIRVGAYWQPISNQFTAMQGRFLIDKNTIIREIA